MRKLFFALCLSTMVAYGCTDSGSAVDQENRDKLIYEYKGDSVSLVAFSALVDPDLGAVVGDTLESSEASFCDAGYSLLESETSRDAVSCDADIEKRTYVKTKTSKNMKTTKFFSADFKFSEIEGNCISALNRTGPITLHEEEL
ncbi:MAG: hypothetical protein ABJN22_05590 [Litorimonas sp.]